MPLRKPSSSDGRTWAACTITPTTASDYNTVTDFFGESAYNSGMPAIELNRDTHAFSHNGSDYSLYTFMTREGVLCYRFWLKVADGQAEQGEARTDLIQRLKKQLSD